MSLTPCPITPHPPRKTRHPGKLRHPRVLRGCRGHFLAHGSPLNTGSANQKHVPDPLPADPPPPPRKTATVVTTITRLPCHDPRTARAPRARAPACRRRRCAGRLVSPDRKRTRHGGRKPAA